MDSAAADRKASAQLEKARRDWLTLDARMAALAVAYADTHLTSCRRRSAGRTCTGTSR